MEVESGRCVRSILPILALFPVLLRSIHAPFRNVPMFPRLVPIRRADQRGASRRALRDHALRQPDRLGKQLGRNDCASILQKTLDEEKATDKKLTTLAESRVNLRGAS
jgi:uncharacterized protein DUF892